MNTLNKICIALTIIFGVSLAVLVAEILIVLLRRRRYRIRRLLQDSDSLHSKSSKHLSYFFCWKTKTTRIEPHAEITIEIPPEAPPATPTPPPTAAPVSELEEIMKQHSLYGPSRVLFTIREEEREEMMEMESSSRCVSFEDIVVSCTPVVIEIDDSTPPFCTPCGSPGFYTPSPSPPRA
ncbi:hypothetical protein M5689_015525 [Euphorbia peplus]|nr:hypothetical protein M5689_015525 [Euphorbia peplus]